MSTTWEILSPMVSCNDEAMTVHSSTTQTRRCDSWPQWSFGNSIEEICQSTLRPRPTWRKTRRPFNLIVFNLKVRNYKNYLLMPIFGLL